MSLVFSSNSVTLGGGSVPANVFVYKGQVETVNDLPTEDVVAGDTYNVVATGDNYTWSGTSWDKLSGKVITTVIKEW